MASSSLEQLVKLGILDQDFLQLDSTDVQIQQSRDHSSGSGSGSDQDQDQVQDQVRDHPDQEPHVVYMDRPQQHSHQLSQLPQQQQQQDDLAYYQNVGYHWLYSSPSYGWWHFSKDDNEKLEQAYRSGQQHLTMDIGQHTFTIDFSKMLQQGGGKPRHLLRSPTLSDIVLKGVAGSRIEKRDILANSQSNFVTLV